MFILLNVNCLQQDKEKEKPDKRRKSISKSIKRDSDTTSERVSILQADVNMETQPHAEEPPLPVGIKCLVFTFAFGEVCYVSVAQGVNLPH